MLVILAPSKQMRNREETIMVIRLFCAAGMSTSLLVKKMEEAAKEKGKQAKVSLNWMQAVLCVEFEDMDEAVAVSMQKSDDVDNVEIEQANEGELL